jgi:RNA polymerase sigma factor (sigma-70 family)
MHLRIENLLFRVASTIPQRSKESSVNTTPAAQAVEVLIHEYGKLVFHTIYGLTGDWEESQELTQDTFLQALKGIDSARAASGSQFHAKAWLLRIALNTVRMQQRRHMLFRFIPFSRLHERHNEVNTQEAAPTEIRERPAAVQPVGYGSIDESDPAETIAEQDAVRRAIATVPEALRVCLLLSVVGGLSTSEIAQMLDLKEAAVRQRIARARKQFQQAYAQESGEMLFEGPVSSDEGEQANAPGAQTHTSRRAIIHAPLLVPNSRYLHG